MSEAEKNKIAQRAVLHVLQRIRSNPVIAEKMGPGSEAFDVLTAAGSALTGEPLAQVRNYVVPGSNKLNHRTVEDFLAEV